MSIYDFKVLDMANKEIALDIYQNKVLLIVNTASKCGLTPQFKQLEELYNMYKREDFEILGFPCGQFNNQELENNHNIKEFCQLNYGVSFKIFSKIDVNGENAILLYKYLKTQKKGIAGVLSQEIKWNFTKFIINREGTVIKRYSPTTNPLNIKKDIDKLI